MTDATVKIPFEFEFQRAMPIALFYLWYYGHLGAYRKLGLDEIPAEKVFAVNDGGVFKVYSQVDNIEKMKRAAAGLSPSDAAAVVTGFVRDFGKFAMKNEMILDKDFAVQLAGEFVLTYILGDIQGHPLQDAALKARVGSENMFYLVDRVLAEKSGVGADYPLYSFDELLADVRLDDVQLAQRQRAILSATAIIPLRDEVANLEEYLSAQGLQLVEKPAVAGPVEIKGQVAFPGLVTGTVKIVLRQSEIRKIQAGDILVSSMTSPDFLPLIKIAAAIVTDEGGITSHAAIVARELKIPCLVGTRFATKLLKDGDLVEVDATNGVVRVI
jgi:phosphohistidine swiveling domain-containing protein